MKFKSIFALSVVAAGVAVYLSWQQPTKLSQDVVSEHADLTVAAKAAETTSALAVNTSKSPDASSKGKVEQIIHDAADANQLIDQQLEAILASETAPDLAVELAPLAQAFPTLKPQIDQYVDGVAEQQQAVAAFRQKVAERNTQVVADGSFSASADGSLDYDKKELLAQAQRLGEQAMALNQAIREAAYGTATP